MTIIYVHGVKVRSPDHGKELAKPFRRWLAPKLYVNNAPPGYEPVYWGDLAARFRWKLASRPKTKLLKMGGDDVYAGLGSLRDASADTPFDAATSAGSVGPGPVLGDVALAKPDTAPPLAAIPVERRPDFLADLYLVCWSRRKDAEVVASEPVVEDPVADDPTVAGLAAAADEVATHWDEIVATELADDARAQALLAAVDAALNNGSLISMGGFSDWTTHAGETLRRAANWPADAVSTVFAELRPALNEFVAYFAGDVFTYLNGRGTNVSPGEIPQRVFTALRLAQARKKATGEKIVIVSHSMGGQLVYDALTYFADHDPTLSDIQVDHWITCGSQVSLFAEMRLFLGQPEVPEGTRLPLPTRVKAWTNFYDLNDFVGFIMEPVFKGVHDINYDTGYGLAFAHTGFLGRPSFFEAMAAQF